MSFTFTYTTASDDANITLTSTDPANADGSYNITGISGTWNQQQIVSLSGFANSDNVFFPLNNSMSEETTPPVGYTDENGLSFSVGDTGGLDGNGNVNISTVPANFIGDNAAGVYEYDGSSLIALTSSSESGTDPACYCSGTRILTSKAEVAVEDLKIGDVVINGSGKERVIRWIGRRSYLGRWLASYPDVMPVLIRAGALGDGLPKRDLRVSPKHAMYLDDVLVPASSLVNGSTIVQERDCKRVDYFHVELEDHDVIWAEGALSETYIDDDSRGMFNNAFEYARLYPDAPAPTGYCAPRIESGFKLEAIRDRTAESGRDLAKAA